MPDSSIPRDAWRQVDGDMNPETHGGTLARYDGDAIELLKIQPVREYVGDREARDVGFAFWTREAYYDFDDLAGRGLYDLEGALAYADMTLGADGCVTFGRDVEPIDLDASRIAIACALLDHGEGGEEGPAGFSDDILPDGEIFGMDGKPWDREAWRSGDDDFRREILGWIDADEREEKIGYVTAGLDDLIGLYRDAKRDDIAATLAAIREAIDPDSPSPLVRLAHADHAEQLARIADTLKACLTGPADGRSRSWTDDLL